MVALEPNMLQFAAADDDPLPAIENLQISGEAFPGRELQACGYSINGTTSCNFEVWFLYILSEPSTPTSSPQTLRLNYCGTILICVFLVGTPYGRWIS